MKRQHALLFAAFVIMACFAALGSQQPARLLLLEWCAKAGPETPPRALLIEMGFADSSPTAWNGKAVVQGATVVQREGYRFHNTDKLVQPDAWAASTHRPMRLPPKNPVAKALEGIQRVGVVLHLTDIQPDATVTVHAPDRKPAVVAIKDALGGQAQKIWKGDAVVRLISTTTPVAAGDTEDDYPAAAYGPDGTLWVAYVGYHVREDDRRIEPAQLKQQPANFKEYFTPGFGDQMFVKNYRQGKWSEPVAITGPREDIVRCAIAVEGTGPGMAWVIYSAQRNGQHRLCARSMHVDLREPGPEIDLPVPGNSERLLNPVACTSQNGSVLVACQSWTTDGARIATCRCTAGKWEAVREFETPGNSWNPAIVAAADGNVLHAADRYVNGDYDISIGDSAAEIASAKFEARPALACDPAGRMWIAYEEGPEQWGKDYGALDDEDGNPLYFARTIRVLCLQDGKLFRPVAELPPLAPRIKSPASGAQAENMPRYAYPKIGIDGRGQIWLTYRVKFGSRYTTHPGPYWLDFARRLEGDRWSEAIEIHHSDGLLDARPVLLPHPAGGLRVIHNSDGRYTTPETIDNQIYMSYVDLPGEAGEPKLIAYKNAEKPKELLARAAREAEAVKRIRGYRVEAAGKKYQLLRGEFHRHTEVSWDGGPDGSLEDMFRYAIDPAGMDWIGNGDHDNGAGREYPWWLTQKLTDAYHVAGRFTPMFSYERSVGYPHGHRNCIFAQRGVRTLPRLAEPQADKRVAGIHADDTKMFYRYLHELDGICAVHTSATGMGTDWRDNDPVVEPIVEIYQGDRMSYEKEAAPRAGYDPQLGQRPANIGGWYPKGYINLALDRGYKLGFQSSSDHFSTHISYCIVLAERHDREAILDGLKKRHCYGATDDIILDVSSGAHVMGDEFTVSAAPRLRIKAIGTAPLAKVEVLKNSEVVKSFEPKAVDFEGAWTDPDAAAGTHYYYVRVQQVDGELAWGSPMWIRMD